MRTRRGLCHHSPETIYPWPQWSNILRTSTSHEEGCRRDWSVSTRRFSGAGGRIEELHAVRLEWSRGADGRMTFTEVPGSGFSLKADLVLLALGFLHPEPGRDR